MEEHQYTLLFVDDEKNILNSIRRLFRTENYNILLANSGSEGLEVLKDHDVSGIISDQRMPGMTGSQFLA
jgi:response regulator RpfG family c-di-GMP phosphodiesterase